MASQQSVEALQRLQAAGQSPFYMHPVEGQELAQEGLIQVGQDQDPNAPGCYRVFLTQQGIDFLNSQQPQTQAAPAPAAPGAPQAPTTPGAQYMTAEQQGQQSQAAPAPAPQQGKPSFAIRDDVPVPKVTRGNASNLTPKESIYPFDQLNVGQSFHVAPTADNPAPHKKMGSNVNAANKRSEIEVQPRQMVNVKKRKLRKDESGNPVKDGEGKKIYDEHIEQEPKTVQTKRFIARRVNADDPNGEGVRVFRVELKPEDQAILNQMQQAQSQQAPAPAPTA